MTREQEISISKDIDARIAAANNPARTLTECAKDFQRFRERLKCATEAYCTCGGLGPEDHGVCPACKIAWAMIGGGATK